MRIQLVAYQSTSWDTELRFQLNCNWRHLDNSRIERNISFGLTHTLNSSLGMFLDYAYDEVEEKWNEWQ